MKMKFSKISKPKRRKSMRAGEERATWGENESGGERAKE